MTIIFEHPRLYFAVALSRDARVQIGHSFYKNFTLKGTKTRIAKITISVNKLNNPSWNRRMGIVLTTFSIMSKLSAQFAIMQPLMKL